MKKNKKSIKKVSKLLTASMVAVPLLMALPSLVEAVDVDSIVVADLEDYINQQIAVELAGTLHRGDSITVDLDDYFADPNDLTYTVVTYNSSIANVALLSGDLHISAKNEGSTMVEVIATASEPGTILHEQFRLTVAPINELDQDGDGIAVDDIVTYIQSNQGRFSNPAALQHLLQAVKPVSTSPNEQPTADASVFNIELASTDDVILNLNDFFYDVEGDTLTYALAIESGSFLEGVALTDNILAISGVLGTTTLTITASDGVNEGVAMKVFDVTVTEVNQAPIDHAPSLIGITQQQQISMDLTNYFAHAGDGIVTYSVNTEGTSGLITSLSDHMLNLSVSGDMIMMQDIEIAATYNGLYTTTAVITIDIMENTASHFLDLSVNDSTLLSEYFHAPAYDQEANELTYSWNGDHPLWLTLDETNGAITVLSSGSHQSGSIMVSADDGQGTVITDSFSLNVRNSSPQAVSEPVTIIGGNDGFFYPYVDLLDIFSDPDDDELTYSIASLPADVTIRNSGFQLNTGFTNTMIDFQLKYADPVIVTIQASDNYGGTVFKDIVLQGEWYDYPEEPGNMVPEIMVESSSIAIPQGLEHTLYFSVSDYEDNPEGLIVSIGSGNEQFIPSTYLNLYTNEGYGNYYLTIDPINVQFEVGNVWITIIVTDSLGATTTQTIDVSVYPVVT